MDIYALTRQLIDIPSVTGCEADAARFLTSLLESLDYKVEAQQVDGDRVNLIATLDSRPRIMLSTHMDTVPPHISSREDEEFIYGRGACDAKGIIAAQISACEQLRAEGITSVGLIFTVDEEAGSIGARAANLHPFASSCEYLINGEPTDNKLAIGSKGSLRATLKTEGRAAHSAYPEQGESAIEKLLDVLAELRVCPWPADDFFGQTTCNIGTISGGTKANVIPSEAHANLQIRLVTDSVQVKDIMERVLRGRAQLEYLSVAEPVRLLDLSGFEQTVVRFTTDIPQLTNWGEPLLLGPGSILIAHTPHERIAKRELSESVELYVQLVHTLIARKQRTDETALATGKGGSG